MSAYQINISMSQETVEELKDLNGTLCLFKAVKSSLKGVPLIWLTNFQLATSMSAGWDDQFFVYASWNEIIPEEVIEPVSECPVTLGQQAVIDDNDNISAKGGGPAGAVSLQNASSMPLTGGMGQSVVGDGGLVCAFPLAQGTVVTVAPVAQVLVMFAMDMPEPGMVVEQAPSPGVLVSFSGPSQASLSYDMANGWSWSGGTSARAIDAGADLVGLLVQG